MPVSNAPVYPEKVPPRILSPKRVLITMWCLYTHRTACHKNNFIFRINSHNNIYRIW